MLSSEGLCRLQEKEKKKYIIMLTLFMNAVLVVDLFRMVFNGNTIIVNSVQYSIYVGTSFFTYWKVINKKKCRIDNKMLILLGGMLLFMIISLFVCREVYQAYSYYCLFFLTRIFPALFFMFEMKEDYVNSFFSYNIRFRGIWLLYTVIGFWEISKTEGINSQYSMTYGYNLLIPACFVFSFFLRNKKIKWLIYTIVMVVAMLMRGSRASFLCFVVFAVMAYIMINKDYFKAGVKARLLIVAFIGTVIVINFNFIINILYKFFPDSRTLYLLATDLSFDSGRSEIQNVFAEAISSNPFSFNGIFSDRVYYSVKTGKLFDLTNYPHHVVYELFYQFGVIIGGLMFLSLVILTIRSVIILEKINKPNLCCLFWVFFVTGFFKLFFSASYLISVEFYLFLGLVICLNFYRKRFYEGKNANSLFCKGY